MKYGYLRYNKPLRAGVLRKMNLGDPIQSYAVRELLHESGIPDADIIPVDRYDAKYYDGEDVTLIVNGIETSETLAYQTGNLPPSGRIRPLYFSISITRPLGEDILANMRAYAPVGCRDAMTLRYLQSKGVDAYLSGCVTLTLPARKSLPAGGKVFLVDVPKSLAGYIPEDVLSKAESLSHIQKIDISPIGQTRLSPNETEEFHQDAYALLTKYREEAALVITGRLHAASPCLAMGIPVVLVRNYYDFRFGFVDKYLHLYGPGEFNKIDWNPKPVDTVIKNDTKELFKALLFGTNKRDALIDKVNRFFHMDRSGTAYQNIHDIVVSKIPPPPIHADASGGFTFSLWGLNRYACDIACAVFRRYPESKMLNVIDRLRKGTFEGMDILHPDKIHELPRDTIIIVAAKAEHDTAKTLLSGSGRRFVLTDKSAAANTECFGFDT